MSSDFFLQIVWFKKKMVSSAGVNNENTKLHKKWEESTENASTKAKQA